MQNKIFRLALFLILPLSILMGCGEEAQEAAEDANKDTVPVIETNPKKDSVNVDSVRK